jgi:hypothetical protein
MLQHYELRGPLASVIVSKVSYRVYGNLVQPNHFVAYLAMGLASLGFLRWRGVMTAPVMVVLSALIVFALAIAGSLSAWAYLGALAMLAGAFFWRQRGPAQRDLFVYCVSLLAALSAMQWLVQLSWMQGATPALTALERLSDVETPGSMGVRLRLWRDAWEIFLQAPWLGKGYGRFAWEHFLQVGAGEALAREGLYHHAHNILMQLLAETGLLGTVIVAGGVIGWVWGLRRSDFDAGLWWLLAVVTVLCLHSMIEYPLWYAYFLGIAAVLLGAAGVAERWRFEGRVPRLLAGCVLLAGAVVAFHTAVRFHMLEAAHNPPAAEVTQQQAGRDVRGLLSARGSLMDPWIELAVARTLVMDRMGIETKLALSAQAMCFLPTPVIAYQHALLLALKGSDRESIELLDRTYRAYPGYLDRLLAEMARLGPGERAGLGDFINRVDQYTAGVALPAGQGSADSAGAAAVVALCHMSP